ncbi:hypothetical protein [Alkalihalobacterium chitinilyticum]|uniref:Uncharacterized protein n=1 Tax=Alkalihalobacterium chitinilyticum TaxID=2980103 RepID=A0ABT5VH15_9BACI|nr:hypothetical protein [Alkalihalobacterium chitinilyticum]MDE5414466.1 hypothetical protein [Alkalihalobacterium chitinilyticum]
MERQELTYVEKLQSVHVLMETRQMLQSKLNELEPANETFEVVKDDLRKIEQEIKAYTGDLPIDEIDQSMSHSLFNPAVIEESDER